MSLLAWIFLGLIAGYVATLILPGPKGGVLWTLVLGIVGAVVGGFLGTHVFGFGDLSGAGGQDMVLT